MGIVSSERLSLENCGEKMKKLDMAGLAKY